MDAKAIRNMQVPAYCPVELGLHDHVNKGVLEEVKNTIAIESIPISMLEDDDMGIELPVEVAIDIPDIVEVGESDTEIVILMPLILLSMIEVCKCFSRRDKTV